MWVPLVVSMSVYPFLIHQHTHLSIHPSIHPSTLPSFFPFFLCYIYPSTHSYVKPSTLSSIYPSIHQYIYPSIHPSFHLYICSLSTHILESYHVADSLPLSPQTSEEELSTSCLNHFLPTESHSGSNIFEYSNSSYSYMWGSRAQCLTSVISLGESQFFKQQTYGEIELWAGYAKRLGIYGKQVK